MKKYYDKKTVMTLLRSSFNEGVESIISIQGGYIRLPLGSASTDAEQLRGDWECVGNDITAAIRKAI